uniref:Uncharacterized protein n=1 Tax=Mustela putorius furo TaxID=9669 RepID=M3Z3L0_MUSPF
MLQQMWRGEGWWAVFSSPPPRRESPLHLPKAERTSEKPGLLATRSAVPRGVHTNACQWTEAPAARGRALPGQGEGRQGDQGRERPPRLRTAPAALSPGNHPPAPRDALSAALTRPLCVSKREGPAAATAGRRAQQAARPQGPPGRAWPPLPSSSSLTSRAAFSPSSRRFRSIILLRSTAALSSALSVQPIVPGARARRRSLHVRPAAFKHRVLLLRNQATRL